ncbi:hypothetical protein [Carnobacterium jeotgali]
MNEKKDIVMLKIKDFFENKDNRKLVRSVFLYSLFNNGIYADLFNF